MWRVSFPNRYSFNTPGYSNPGARQGYYVDCTFPSDAVSEAIKLAQANPTDPVDIQDWNNKGSHGKIVMKIRPTGFNNATENRA